jgi:hypothetical protein
MTMKTFLLDDILLIGEVPDRLNGTEAQALFEQIDKWFRSRDGDAAAPGTGRTRGETSIHHFEQDMTSQTTKDS